MQEKNKIYWIVLIYLIKHEYNLYKNTHFQ